MPGPDDRFERDAPDWPVCGIDEAGRGPWAGPVTAGAVILDLDRLPAGLNDSKKLSPARREALFDEIRATAICGIGAASVEEIDRLNILQATYLAMRRAVAALPVTPRFALVDGNRMPPDLPCPGLPVVKGDARSLSIAAASILAKVSRDRAMAELSQQHPQYGWERNAGYGVKAHQEALKIYGVTPHHRRSFKPIHNMLCKDFTVSD
ncbi:ribonuclease HII [Oceanomicrobium pacificus]|uniref:Ribonuclease HII n=1 Tax=Oceanomicrobium pacificus TaxID=2692916 RepID=A0A6B0TT47_9RHOB|nr:ribonuclease HII [Oceanomicrobium pacificus]MXU64848.1 ribonuclease HII [Oceanomicrobium pacificus]